MAFNPIEVSNDQGRPVFLYEFRLHDTVWAYTTSPFEVLIGGIAYTPCAISDDGIKQSGDVSTDTLTITAPSTIGPAQLFIGTPPSAEVFLTIRHMHHGDNEAPIVYQGQVIQADFPTPGTAKIKSLPLAALMDREGLRLCWQRGCPYMLYDPMTCKVDKEEFAIQAVVESAQNGIVVAAAFAGYADGHFNGGFLEWEHPVRGREFRGIEEHIGNNIRLFGLTDGLYPGVEVTAYPGCDLTASTCKNKFNNLVNYGGIPHLPGKSPFDGTPIV